MSDPQTTGREGRPAEGEIPQQETRAIPQRFLIIGIAVVVILLAVLVVLTILAFRFDEHTQTLRDIAIIALALESGLIGLAILVLIVQIARLTNMLEFEIKPILENTNDTIRTVRGTADFMSSRLVSPVIKASGYASGIARVAGSLGSLVRIGRAGTRSEGRGQGTTQVQKEGEDER